MAAPQLLERAEQWLARRWVPALINIGAAALLSYSLAQGTWRLLTPAVAEYPQRLSSDERAADDYDLQALIGSNLFGHATAAPEPSVEIEAIPESTLNLVLTGVMVTRSGSYALISTDGGPELPFGIGQEIAPGATLYAVYADRVLIRRNGATESLILKEADNTGVSTSVAAPAASASSNQIIQSRTGGNFTIDREQLTQQMQKPEFLSQALMVPNAGGGFLVREIQPGSIYEKLGLRVGDVITTVNGQAVNTVEDVMRLYSQFGTTRNVEINIRRAGQDQTLVYDIQ